MKYNEWNIPLYEAAVPPALAEAGYSPLLSALLCLRGVTTPRFARLFLEGGTELLTDPLTITDMAHGVMRILRAVKDGEKVAVYGDYDVDGITSACLMTDYLRSRGLDTELYIPDRLEEGYGLNTAAIDVLHSRDVSLIVTVDCGVTAVRETEYAASLGIDMVITDHHECSPELPKAAAVINPKRQRYPGGELAGVGVAFKLICAVEGDVTAMLERYADLVAVGTIADVMPMTGENRVLVRKGLRKLTENPNSGLLALMREAGIADKKPDSSSVGFVIAPRLNAAGRMGVASLAAELLLERDGKETAKTAARLCQLNRKRQETEAAIWAEALTMLSDHEPGEAVVLAKEGWHQGVIGIVASRLAEYLRVPAVMISLDGENGRGSCRSFGGFNLYEALTTCGEYLEGFGGHALAAGLSVKMDRVGDFARAFNDVYRNRPADSPAAGLDIDLIVSSPELLEPNSVESLELLEPYGSGSPRPTLCLLGASLDTVTPLSGGKHLKLGVSKFSRRYECVFFSCTENELALKPGDTIDLAFFPKLSNYRGRNSVQLQLTDARRAGAPPICERVLSEDEPDLTGAEGLAPSRPDFTRLWRRLTSLGGSVSGGIADVLTEIGPGEHPVRLCFCLKVFSEVELTTMSVDDGRLQIKQNTGGGKADLTESKLLRRLTH